MCECMCEHVIECGECVRACLSVYVCACLFFEEKENHKDVCSKHYKSPSFSFPDVDCPNTYSKQLVFQGSNLNVVVLGCHLVAATHVF